VYMYGCGSVLTWAVAAFSASPRELLGFPRCGSAISASACGGGFEARRGGEV